MKRSRTGNGIELSRAARWILVASLASSLACGTLLYPERRHHDHPHGHVDPAVIVMDGVLLFFFVVPGVVAFAVDIATGAIYEPHDGSLALRDASEPPHVDASQARRLAIGGSPGRIDGRPDPIWWETPDGRRIPTRIAAGLEPGSWVVESETDLEPGEHRLVLTGADGRERAVVIAVR